MSALLDVDTGKAGSGCNGKTTIIAAAQHAGEQHGSEGVDGMSAEEVRGLERKLVRKIDLRLCTIAGILCSLNLLDSGIISSASVTTIFEDLGLGVGNRYSISIIVYTVASVTFQLPATVAVRMAGPRLMFSFMTVSFGIITMVSHYIFSNS
jgi:hypothetical protein